MLQFEINDTGSAQIRVIGVGGGGGNATNRMVDAGVKGVEFVAVNTYKAALIKSKANQKIQIGDKTTAGMGAGGNPDNGRAAAEESRDEIAAAIKDANMIFITAGRRRRLCSSENLSIGLEFLLGSRNSNIQ